MSERASKQISTAKQAVQSKQMSEWCVGTSGQASEWPWTSRFMAVLNHSAAVGPADDPAAKSADELGNQQAKELKLEKGIFFLKE